MGVVFGFAGSVGGVFIDFFTVITRGVATKNQNFAALMVYLISSSRKKHPGSFYFLPAYYKNWQYICHT
jgi:hypothetical protein